MPGLGKFCGFKLKIHAVTWGCKINAANNCKYQRRHLSYLSTVTFQENIKM